MWLAEKGRYHLYVSLACPWASRCLAVMYMKGLDDFVGLSVVHPVFQRTRPSDPEDEHVGWAFVDPDKTPSLPGPSGVGTYSSEGSTPDEVNGVKFVRDLYEMCAGQGATARYSVPLLWDKKERAIVSNESADIVRMFNAEFNDLVTPAAAAIDLYPEELCAEIDAVNEWVYNDINNGVYKCGFSSTQEAYDAAAAALFASLDRAEAILSEHRFLVGDRFTEADLRLFVTLIRFDEVYAVHFKANKKLIQQYPNLSNVSATHCCSGRAHDALYFEVSLINACVFVCLFAAVVHARDLPDAGGEEERRHAADQAALLRVAHAPEPVRDHPRGPERGL